jgi:hypothetical protein
MLLRSEAQGAAAVRYRWSRKSSRSVVKPQAPSWSLRSVSRRAGLGAEKPYVCPIMIAQSCGSIDTDDVATVELERIERL